MFATGKCFYGCYNEYMADERQVGNQAQTEQDRISQIVGTVELDLGFHNLQESPMIEVLTGIGAVGRDEKKEKLSIRAADLARIFKDAPLESQAEIIHVITDASAQAGDLAVVTMINDPVMNGELRASIGNARALRTIMSTLGVTSETFRKPPGFNELTHYQGILDKIDPPVMPPARYQTASRIFPDLYPARQ